MVARVLLAAQAEYDLARQMRTLRIRFPPEAIAALCVIGSVVSAMGVGPVASADAASASIRALTTGVTNPENIEPLAFEHIRGAGARFVRIPLEWESIAPTAQPARWQPDDPADPHYQWDGSDSAVIRAIQAGVIPVLQIDGAPSWVQRCTAPAVLPSAICDPDPAALAAFATAAARRYSGQFAGLPRVQYWQALNEPNLSLFFFPQFDESGKPFSPALYRQLVNAFYAGVKSVNADNLVLAAGLGPVAVRSWTIGPMRFARLLFCMTGGDHPHPSPGKCDGGVHFDILAIQPYTTGGPTHKGRANDVELGDLKKLKILISAADQANRIKGTFRHTPLWITEFSWDSNPPDPGGLPMRIETRWTAEALYEAWKSGVSHFFWFSLQDGKRTPGQSFSETLESGLYFRGNSIEEDMPKEFMYAFRFPFVAYPHRHGLSFWGRTPNSRRGKVVIQIWKQNRWRRATVTHADSHGMFLGTAPTHYGHGKRGFVRALYHGDTAIPFSMRPVPDFRQPPFG